MKPIFAWVEKRTGIGNIFQRWLEHIVPGGPNLGRALGACILFTLLFEALTGILLATAYSPSTVTAWESVHHIQHNLNGGWFLRGVHRYLADVLSVLVPAWMLWVVWNRRYLAPGELRFWCAIGLLCIGIAMVRTGLILPWDQEAYWGGKIAVGLIGNLPLIGPMVMDMVVGGPEFGNQTLTRMNGLHGAILPLLAIGLLFMAWKSTPKAEPDQPACRYWPEQASMDALCCLGMLCLVSIYTFATHGAPLHAPADPSVPYEAARPEWYFRFLFQLLKVSPGITGSILIPFATIIILFLMPLIGKSETGRAFNKVFIVAMLACMAILTWQSFHNDKQDLNHQGHVKQAQKTAQRAAELASIQGIPPSGAAKMLRQDAKTQGARLFAYHCATCHLYDGHNGLGRQFAIHQLKEGENPAKLAQDRGLTLEEMLSLNDLSSATFIQPETKLLLPLEQSAPDLHRMASREWLTDLLHPDRYQDSRFFGNTNFREGKMVKKVLGKMNENELKNLQKVAIALSAQAHLPYQQKIDARDSALIKEGISLMLDEFACIDCHQFNDEIDEEEATAPDLTGYGSREWILAILHNPAHPRFYGKKNDRMPAFGKDEKLSPQELGLITDWIRMDWPSELQIKTAIHTDQSQTTIAQRN